MPKMQNDHSRQSDCSTLSQQGWQIRNWKSESQIERTGAGKRNEAMDKEMKPAKIIDLQTARIENLKSKITGLRKRRIEIEKRGEKGSVKGIEHQIETAIKKTLRNKGVKVYSAKQPKGG